MVKMLQVRYKSSKYDIFISVIRPRKATKMFILNDSLKGYTPLGYCLICTFWKGINLKHRV